MSNKIVYNDFLKPYAQRLRREMTRQERHLWYDYLKSYPATFRRQKQFGKYIADFYCASARLIVEIDGSQHYEPEAREDDSARESYLRGLGLNIRASATTTSIVTLKGYAPRLTGKSPACKAKGIAENRRLSIIDLVPFPSASRLPQRGMPHQIITAV